VSATQTAAGYTTRQVSDVVGLSPKQVGAMVRDGLLNPERDSSDQPRFLFRDIVLLRTAKELRAAGVSQRRLRRALLRLRDRLPPGVTLSEVSIAAAGGRVVVRDGQGVFEVETGQVELDLETHARTVEDTGVSPVQLTNVGSTRGSSASPLGPAAHEDADEAYNLGIDLESVSTDQAREAYERALSLRPDHADARANLGRLLHQQGRVEEAERQYRAALEHEPGNVIAAFNLGVALEDLGRPDAALEAYELSLRANPSYAAAHFNLARLFEQEGRKDAALRHLADYRKAMRE